MGASVELQQNFGGLRSNLRNGPSPANGQNHLYALILLELCSSVQSLAEFGYTSFTSALNPQPKPYTMLEKG